MYIYTITALYDSYPNSGLFCLEKVCRMYCTIGIACSSIFTRKLCVNLETLQPIGMNQEMIMEYPTMML